MIHSLVAICANLLWVNYSEMAGVHLLVQVNQLHDMLVQMVLVLELESLYLVQVCYVFSGPKAYALSDNLSNGVR